MNGMKITIKENEVKTQTDAILWHLGTFKTITSWNAIKEYGATRLSGIIFVLRKRGYNIVTNPELVKNRFGRNTEIARYEYIEPIPTPKQVSLFEETDVTDNYSNEDAEKNGSLTIYPTDDDGTYLGKN